MAFAHGIPVYCIYASPTRPGSGFIQSLFDGHPEIATIPDLSDDWNYVIEGQSTKTEEICLRFFARNPGVFDSRLNQIERFHELGQRMDEFSKVSFREFARLMSDHLGDETGSNSDVFFASHLAYHQISNKSFSRPKAIVYHSHTFDRTVRIQQLVKDPICIYAVRNPVNGIARAMQGFRDARKVWHLSGESPWFDPENYFNLSFYARNFAILARDLHNLRTTMNDVRVVGFERLHENAFDVLFSDFCSETGVKCSEILLQSTFWGLAWHGDHKSSSSKSGFNREPRRDVASGFYFKYDRLVVEWLYQDLIQDYALGLSESLIPRTGSLAHRLLQVMIPLLVLLPSRHELRTFARHLKARNGALLGKSFLWFAYRSFVQLRTLFRKD